MNETTEAPGSAEQMRDALMARTGVAEHLAAAALRWAVHQAETLTTISEDRFFAGMEGYALGLAAMEQHMIDRARGARDDLHALALRARSVASAHLSEATLTVGARHAARMESGRVHRGRSDAYMTAANLLAHSFSIAEACDDDPADAKPIRMLDDEGAPLAADQQVTYVARGVLSKPVERDPAARTVERAIPELVGVSTSEDHSDWPLDRSGDE